MDFRKTKFSREFAIITLGSRKAMGLPEICGCRGNEVSDKYTMIFEAIRF